MEIELTIPAQKDLEQWRLSGNNNALKRIKALLASIIETPYQGIGKPEALRYHLSGKWSRRINQQHRIIYEINDGSIIIQSLKGHYSNLCPFKKNFNYYI